MDSSQGQSASAVRVGRRGDHAPVVDDLKAVNRQDALRPGLDLDSAGAR